jgi:hypothetical protein
MSPTGSAGGLAADPSAKLTGGKTTGATNAKKTTGAS